MKYSLVQFEAFLTVMEYGTVTAAAARLNVSKSVVSKRVGELELGLSVALFRRHAGRLSATEAAEQLVMRLRPLMSELQAAAESVTAASGAELRGNLSITAPMTFGTVHLTPVLSRFAALHPRLNLRIDYEDRMRDLARDGFDIAIRVGASPSGNLISKLLCEERMYACAAPALLERLGRPGSLAEIAGWPVIGYSHLSNAELWQFQIDGTVHTADVVETMSSNNGESMRDLAAAGLCLAMLPGFIAVPALELGVLEEILPHLPTRRLPVMAVWPPVHPMPAKLRLFIDHLADSFAGGTPFDRAVTTEARSSQTDSRR